jgi:hypothetical protein
MQRCRPLLPALFTLTIFVSALLLFLVQPLVGKMLLPLLGGTPQVWNTCMVFFQAALLAGYTYAHLGPAWLGLRTHTLLHLALLAAALFVLPIAIPASSTPPADANPIPWLLGALLMGVGLPFFLVSASAPLLQCWFANTRHPAASDPYFLYAASNLGSLLALLAYPALVEPTWPLAEQSGLWALGYCALVVLASLCALCACVTPLSPLDVPVASGAPPTLPRRLRWAVLAFVPSSLMLSVTTHLTTDIAPVPLLWVVPLALYLLTFTLVFARRSLNHRALARGAPIVVVVLLLALLSEATDPVWLLLGAHLLGLFVLATVCHGELARDRPPAEYLTGFYLWLSLGGVLGGAFTALLAPLLFPGHAEYPLGLVLACLLLPPAGRRAAQPRPLLDVALPVALGLMTVALILLGRLLEVPAGPARVAVMFALPVAVCYAFADRPLRFGLGVGAVLLASLLAPSVHGRIVYQVRSFFGVHRVTEDPQRQLRVLVHGSTVHGRQSLDPSRQGEPLAYYHKGSPAGGVFAELERRPRARIGLVGLGAGSLAAYGRPGQRLTYYEIDPAVIHIARTYFTFLRDCPAGEPEVIPGDARLTLAQAPAAHYQLLVIDAFSSDAIPLHLLTREALQLYLSKLAPDGILALHISNRYLHLEPVLADLAADAGLVCRVRSDLGSHPAEQAAGKAPSQWAVLARRPEHLGRLARNAMWAPAASVPGGRVWTDDYSNVLQVFAW